MQTPQRSLGQDGGSIIAWDGTAVDCSGFGSVLIEVTAYTSALTVKGGVGGSANTLAVKSLGDTTAALAATITGTGLYVVPAAGFVSMSGGAFTANLMFKA